MKKIELTLEDIFNLPTAVIYNPDAFKPVRSVSVDSRRIKRNTLFVAIKGERLDGHDFIEQAVKNGAASLLIDERMLRKIGEYDIPVITVKDTTKALGDLAGIWRGKLKAVVIGITGSAGKTTTKEILVRLLAQKFNVNKTIANKNNHIGVPLTILSTNEKHDILVAELGTNHFGEIEYTAKIALPDFALITNIGDSHLEFLKDRRGVLKEKSALVKYTLRNGGGIFINNDDELLKKYGYRIKDKVTYAVGNKADYRGVIKSYDRSGRPEVEIWAKSRPVSVKLPLIGEKNVINYLASFAVASEMGLKSNSIIKATAKLKPFDKRLEIRHYKNFSLINDTYNANPDSMRSSLGILKQIKNRKIKIAVLGDMFELGMQSRSKHQDLGSYINKLNLDAVYTIGRNMTFLQKALNGRTKVHNHFTDRESLKNFLIKLNCDSSVILIKGSRGMQMEEFVSIIESRKK